MAWRIDGIREFGYKASEGQAAGMYKADFPIGFSLFRHSYLLTLCKSLIWTEFEPDRLVL